MGLSPSQVALYSSGPVTLSHSLLTQGSPLAPINAGLLLIAAAWLRLRCIISGPIHSGDHRRCVVHQPCSREIMNQRLPSYCYTLGHEGFLNEYSFMNLCVGDNRIREITAIKEYDLIWAVITCEIVRSSDLASRWVSVMTQLTAGPHSADHWLYTCPALWTLN